MEGWTETVKGNWYWVFGKWRATVVKKDDGWYATVDVVVFVTRNAFPYPTAAAAMAMVQETVEQAWDRYGHTA
jgi:hypothetical protein